MHVSVPHNISDLSITFFAGGRPYEVQKSSQHFGTIRNILLGWDERERAQVDIDALIKLADPAFELKAAAGGQLSFQGNQILYAGTALHNIWVDKILAFKEAGENFDPIFRALEDLQLNPTPAARERLPIFVERSKLGFLPDGRIAAFKGVRGNFNDVHSNTVNYAVGTTVAMPRHECNANPDQTCTAGLHLGAIDYINTNGFGWGEDRRMLLCAFWPRHVVAVPTDYQGGKMRVEQLTVLDEVDRGYVDRLLSNGRTIIRGYETPAAPEPAPAAKSEPTEAWEKAKVGDWVKVSGDSDLDDGAYLVAEIDENNDDARLIVKTGSSETSEVENDAVDDILTEAPAWFRAKVGDWVKVTIHGESYFAEVTEVDDSALNPYSDARLKLHDGSEQDWVDNDLIMEIPSEKPAVWARVRMEDQVTIEGHDVLRDGTYRVIEIFDNHLVGEDEERIGIEVRDEPFAVPNKVVKSIKRETDDAQVTGVAATVPAGTSLVVVDPASEWLAIDTLKPLLDQVEVGDRVRVDGSKSAWVVTGDYEVSETKQPSDSNLRVQVPSDGRYWIENGSVTHVRKKAVAAAPAPTPEKPVWELVQAGDVIRIENEGDNPDGLYTVSDTDSDLFRGGSKTGIQIVDNEGDVVWIYNRGVKEIVERNGKPYSVPTTPVVDARPLHKQVEVGDRIRVEGSHDTPDGEYEVSTIDNFAISYRVAVNYDGQNGGIWWVGNNTVKAIVRKGPAPVVSEPAWKAAKVGDTIKIAAIYRLNSGHYEVVEVDASNGMDRRLKVRHPGGTRWIDNNMVEAIVTVAVDNGPAYLRAKVGDVVTVRGSAVTGDGDWKVTDIDEGDSARLQVDGSRGKNWVANDYIVAIVKVA